MMMRLCAIGLLLAVAQARFIVLTNQETDDWQASSSDFGEEQHESHDLGPLSLRSLNPLSWFLPGPGQRVLAPSLEQASETRPDLMEDMLRHVRCSRLRAALRDWQTAKRVDELDLDSGMTHTGPQADIRREQLAEQDQHASFLGQLISSTHAASQLPEGVVKQAYQQQQQQQQRQQQHHDDMIILHDVNDAVIDADEAQWTESPNVEDNTDSAAYAEQDLREYHSANLDTQTLWARAREAGERYRREELDAQTTGNAGNGQHVGQLVVDEEAAELQRDLNQMLGSGSSQQQEQQNNDLIMVQNFNGAQVADIIEVGSNLATHLLRGMATAAQRAQDAADQAQAAIENEEEAQESTHAEGGPHSGSEVLVLYPYDQEMDDVFAIRGALQSGGRLVESGSGTLLFLHPLAFAAHMVRDLRRRFDTLWSLQLEDAMAQFMMPHMLEQDDLGYAYDGYAYEYEEDEAINGADDDDNSGNDLFFPLVAGSAQPLFWWNPSSSIPGASGAVSRGAGPREVISGGGPFPWMEGREAPLEEEEGLWHTGVALLCVLLLAVAFMVTAFVRSLGSLRRVMRRQDLLVPFLVEGNDGTYTQGYMLVDEAQLLAAAAASGHELGRKNPQEAVPGAKALPSPTGAKEDKASAQAAWKAIEERQQQQQQQAAADTTVAAQTDKDKEEV